MWQYFAVIAAIAAGIICRGLRYRSWYFWMVIAALCLLAGLRYNVGLDTVISMGRYAYLPTLKDMTLNSVSRTEGGRLGWILILLKTYGVGTWPWQLLCAVILNVSFAWVLKRYARLLFIGIACWCLFGYITLDFETMLAGAAAGCLTAGIPDLAEGRYGRFYIKLMIGALFHLSVLALFWLPIACSRKIQRLLMKPRSWLIVLLAALPAALGIKAMIIAGVTLLDKIPELGNLGFSSEYILKYGDSILKGAGLNIKGYLGMGISNVLMPLGAAWLLLRAKKETRVKTLIGLILIFYAVLEMMRFEVIAFGRLSMLLLPVLAIGLTLALEECRTKGLRIGWIATVAFSAVIGLKGLFDPMPLTGEGRRIEMYYPYCSWIDKGIVYRRAWLAFDYMLVYDNQESPGRRPIYDFTFELKPGEREVRSPFHPACTHADMERLRRDLCPGDSVAPVVPLGFAKH